MTVPRRAASADELRALIDVELGPTSWVSIAQEKIDAFARITGDDQWIHVDAARAASTDLGVTIAHGLLTLSIGPNLVTELLDLDVEMGFNYGYEKVRFPAPLPVDARVRVWATVLKVTEVPGGIQLLTRQRYEREGHDKPVCVADSIALLVPARS